eukprot:7513724-Karenia_brevis.AAC.1
MESVYLLQHGSLGSDFADLQTCQEGNASPNPVSLDLEGFLRASFSEGDLDCTGKVGEGLPATKKNLLTLERLATD